MKKELAPGLFGENTGGTDFRQFELQSINPLAEVQRLEKRFDGLVQELRLKQDESNKNLQARFELFIQKLAALESKFEALNQDIRTKYSSLSGKVTERNLTDMKTQALIDRHTQILRQFEVRVSQLQKTNEEQEYQIMAYKASLDEARKELAKLKKL